MTNESSGPITIYKTKETTGGEDVCFLARSAPATPYQVYAAMEGALLDPTEYSGFGIGLRESSSGKLTLMVLSMNGGSVFPADRGLQLQLGNELQRGFGFTARVLLALPEVVQRQG